MGVVGGRSREGREEAGVEVLVYNKHQVALHTVKERKEWMVEVDEGCEWMRGVDEGSG